MKPTGLSRRMLLTVGSRIALFGTICVGIGSTIVAACGGGDDGGGDGAHPDAGVDGPGYGYGYDGGDGYGHGYGSGYGYRHR